MRVTRLFGRPWVGSFATLLFALTPAACTSLLGDFNNGGTNPDASSAGDGSSSPNNGPDATMTPDGPASNNDSGASIGATCNAGSQCASGFCADGVCCNNACAGTCESCNQSGKMGTCSPIAAMTDPEKECVMIAPPDAGAVDSGSEAGGGDAAADAGDAALAEGGTQSEAGAGDAATTDAAPVEAGPSLGYNPPDGGVTTNMAKCAGSCDGKGGNGGGSCVYPDSTTICGTQFCNTSTQKGAFVCDSAGHCGLSLTQCTDYSCSSSTGTCGTACSTQADCLPTDFCDGLNCHPKRGTGVPCTAPSQCTSGFCDDTVCCDTDCSMTTGGNCNLTAAKAGTCSCSACSTGPCAVFYHDGDGDGYGDPATTKVACASGPPPVNYVTNNQDCDDGDARVNPGQTAYFGSPSLGTHTFDYNCDGTLEKGIPEYPSYFGPSYCGFCSSVQSTSPACYVSTYSCTNMGDQSTLGCSEYFGRLLSDTTPRITTQAAPISICTSCFFSYCGDSPTADPNYQSDPGSGFAGSVGCGTSGTFVYCGTCGASTGSPNSYSYSNTQTCH
jgi:hypothetical protein